MTQITTERITTYDHEIFTQIGQLMPNLDESFSPMGPVDERHWNRFFKGNQERTIFVAKHAGAVVGSLVTNTVAEQAPEATSTVVGGVIVSPLARGQGIGMALLRRAAHHSRERGITNLTLNTETNRPAAGRLYERFGFSLVPFTDSHYSYSIPPANIPNDVRNAFELGNDSVVTPVESGRVNRTYLIEDGEHTRIVQCLNDSFDPRLLADSSAVAEHLSENGWEAPVTLPSTYGRTSYSDARMATWRSISFIESDGCVPEQLGSEQLRAVGALLGRWHQTMSTLDYDPLYSIPHFHDTKYHADRLRTLKSKLPSSNAVDQAVRILATYEDLPPLPNGPVQLLHGDPQLTNILFRDGKPFTYIDLDTIMRGPIWLDIGDLLRAKAETDIESGLDVDISALCHIAEGYRLAVMPDVDQIWFRKNSLLAAKTIACELAIRFMNDVVDDSYFSWDNKTFRSRRDNHMHRAGIQQQVVNKIDQSERV